MIGPQIEATTERLKIVNSNLEQAIVAAWAAKNLPARLDVETTAKVLGFAEHDIQILMAARKLTPLGDPAPNAPKWFSAMEVIQLAADREWLNKATKEVSKYWHHKRDRLAHSGGGRSGGSSRNNVSIAGKASPKSSPDSSPAEHSEGDDGAMSRSE